MNSDEIVEALRPYGRVCVFQSSRDGTFSADIELYVKGMKAEVKSGFRHPTMLAALTNLQTNLHEAIGQLQPAIEGEVR